MGGGRRRPLYVDVVVAVVVIALIGVVGVWLNGRSGGSDRSSALVPADGGSSQGGPTEPRTVETVPVVTGSVPRSSSGDDGGQGGATRSTLPREQRAKVSGTAAAVSRLVLRNASGAEATVVIKRGKLEAQAEGATNGAVLGEECDFDEDADAAMPLDITVEAAAPPAAYSLSVEMDFRAPTDFDRSSPSLVVDTEALHSPDTRVCIFRHENRPIFATVRGNGVTSASTRGWVIVAGYLKGDRAENRKKLERTGWWIRPGKAYPGDAYSVVSTTGAMSVTLPIVNTTLAALPFAPGYELGCAPTANC